MRRLLVVLLCLSCMGLAAHDGYSSSYFSVPNTWTALQTFQTIKVNDIRFSSAAAPGAPTVAKGAAGALTGTFNYKVTWVAVVGNFTEETELGAVSANIDPLNQKVIITRPTTSPTQATGWRVYRSLTGPTATWYSLSTVVAIATTTYTDEALDATLTADKLATDKGSTFGTGLYVSDFEGTPGIYGSGFLGSKETAFGRGALVNQTVGFDNTAFGHNAATGVTYGKRNTAIGTDTLMLNVGANDNTVVGDGAGRNTTGAGNVAVGTGAYYHGTTGEKNTCIGLDAGYGVAPTDETTTGEHNTYIGAYAGQDNASQLSNSTALGYFANTTKSNQVVFGDSSVTEVCMGTAAGLATGIAKNLAEAKHYAAGAPRPFGWPQTAANAADNEFEGESLAAWSWYDTAGAAAAAPSTANQTDYPGFLHLSNDTTAYEGFYLKTVSWAGAFDIMMKVDAPTGGNTTGVGLVVMLADGNGWGGAIKVVNSGNPSLAIFKEGVAAWNPPDTNYFITYSGVTAYFHLVRAAGTDVMTLSYSHDGRNWKYVDSGAFAGTITTAGVYFQNATMGVIWQDGGASCSVDFFRVSAP